MKIIKVIYIALILITLMSTFFMINCSAGEPKLGISLDLYDPLDEKILDSSEDIILALNIVNNYDYWVMIGGGYNEKPEFIINIVNEEKDVHYNNLFAGEMFIEPKSEIKLYFPFDHYNDKKPDYRLGIWQLQPKLTLNGFKLYEKPYQSKAISTFSIETPSTNNPIIGNVLEFTTKTPDVEVTNNDEIGIIDIIKNYLFKENKTIFDALFISIVISIIGGGMYVIKKFAKD